MKYTAPAGKPAGSPYVDGNLSAGVLGDIPPAAAIEHPQREIVDVIDYAGLTPSGADLTQLRKAIIAIYESLSGGGETENYLTLAQARTRLPIFPEIQTADNRINVSSPGAGSILVPSGVTFLYRGIDLVSTSDYDAPARTFATAASKTYHLRWTRDGGFALKDLADGGYNPTAAAEGSPIFDTTIEDMLVARVITNASNVAAITNLANKDRLFVTGESDRLTPASHEDEVPPSALSGPGEVISLNWARTPRPHLTGFTDVTVQVTTTQFAELNIVVKALSRYQIKVFYQRSSLAATAWVAYSAEA